MNGQKVIVVGAGIGGLCAAVDLAAAGRDVLVLERAPAPGGKLREVEIGGARMDAGPTVFTMRWVLDELFDRAGCRLDDHLTLSPMRVLARHAWNKGAELDLFADAQQTRDAIGVFAGAAAARGFEQFSARAAEIYRTLDRSFIRDSRPTPLSLARRVGLAHLGALMRISPFVTLWDELGKYFPDPRLRQLFGRYATYCGTSPFRAPATLMLVAHVEQQGVWCVEGGMHRVALEVAALAERSGAHLRYSAHVDRILVHAGRVAGVELNGGERLHAGQVIFNGDAGALPAGRLGDAVSTLSPPVARPSRSLSAVTWNLRVVTSGFPLVRHNVFFCDDYHAEFNDAVVRSRLPRAPSVYVCAQDRGDGGAAGPHGPERLLCIVNAPAIGDAHSFSQEELELCQANAFERLRRNGLHLQRTADDQLMTTPTDLDRLYPATGGALYGQASQGWLASFRRPAARTRLPGLYLAGGSTHPGPGVPMAALSGRQAALSAQADRTGSHHPVRASMSPSAATVTPGGTSTR